MADCAICGQDMARFICDDCGRPFCGDWECGVRDRVFCVYLCADCEDAQQEAWQKVDLTPEQERAIEEEDEALYRELLGR